VIGEFSRNAKGGQCFNCQGYGYVVSQCPSSNLLIKEADDDDEIEIVVYEPTGSAGDFDDVRVFLASSWVSLDVHTSHTAVSNED